MSPVIFNILKSCTPRTALAVMVCLAFLPTFASAKGASIESEAKPQLVTALNSLFSHKRHQLPFQSMGISCTECHSFAVKSQSFDPLAENVESGFLKPSRKVCHECHLGKIQTARVNQCSLCHLNPAQLKPESHKLDWRSRHGQFAQMDPESCNSCHRENQNACSNCHTQRSTMKPNVHRPNFRMFHSIEARINPAKCSTCHASTSFCIQCHKGDGR